MGACFFFLVRAPSIQQNKYMLVVFKVYLGATMFSARGYSGISKYFENIDPSISPSVLAVYSHRLLPE